MKNRKTALGLVSLLCLALASGGVAAAEEGSSLLFAVTPSDITISCAKNGACSLSLPAASRTIWFTDRPERHAGAMKLSQLTDQWAEGFGNDPPNAALVFRQGKKAYTHVVTLGAPTKSKSGKRLSFDLTPVEDATQTVAGHTHAHQLHAGKFSGEVFIDNFTYCIVAPAKRCI